MHDADDPSRDIEHDHDEDELADFDPTQELGGGPCKVCGQEQEPKVTIKTHTDRWWITLCGECNLPLSVGVYGGGRRCFKCGSEKRREVNVVDEATVTRVADKLDRWAVNTEASAAGPIEEFGKGVAAGTRDAAKLLREVIA